MWKMAFCPTESTHPALKRLSSLNYSHTYRQLFTSTAFHTCANIWIYRILVFVFLIFSPMPGLKIIQRKVHTSFPVGLHLDMQGYLFFSLTRNSSSSCPSQTQRKATPYDNKQPPNWLRDKMHAVFIIYFC